jgi:long-subunit fatty acid transport protein
MFSVTRFCSGIFAALLYGDLSLGVGLSVPFGLETDYSPGWVGRYASLRTKLTTFDIQPTIAYRLFGKFDSAFDIVSAAVTFRWGGPAEAAPLPAPELPGKEPVGYSNKRTSTANLRPTRLLSSPTAKQQLCRDICHRHKGY